MVSNVLHKSSIAWSIFVLASILFISGWLVESLYLAPGILIIASMTWLQYNFPHFNMISIGVGLVFAITGIIIHDNLGFAYLAFAGAGWFVGFFLQQKILFYTLLLLTALLKNLLDWLYAILFPGNHQAAIAEIQNQIMAQMQLFRQNPFFAAQGEDTLQLLEQTIPDLMIKLLPFGNFIETLIVFFLLYTIMFKLLERYFNIVPPISISFRYLKTPDFIFWLLALSLIMQILKLEPYASFGLNLMLIAGITYACAGFSLGIYWWITRKPKIMLILTVILTLLMFFPYSLMMIAILGVFDQFFAWREKDQLLLKDTQAGE